LALEYLSDGFTDIIDHSDQQFMGIGWFSFLVADEMRDPFDKRGSDIGLCKGHALCPAVQPVP